MIATYEKLDSPVKAREHASLLIIISPRAPEGYLRLAKALRLCDTAQSPDTTARCRWIYRQAIESVQAYGNKDHDKLKVLAGLLRRDIIGSLPVELRNIILGNLSNADLCRSMRVSKSWKGVCLDPTLWKHLTIVKNWSAAKPRPLRKRAFNNIITKRAQANVKSLTLWGVYDFGISLETFKATLKVLDRLEFLSLKGTDGVDGTDLDFPGAPPCHEWSKSVFEGAPPCLKTLRLGGFRTMDLPPDWPLPSRIPMAQSLEELSLGHLTGRSVTPRMLLSTVWPKLTKLKMVRTKDHFPLRVDLELLAKATPSLKDLCIRDPLGCSKAFSMPVSWENLERLELTMQSPNDGVHLGDDVLILPKLPPTTRSLVFPRNAISLLGAYRQLAQEEPDIIQYNAFLTQLGHPPVSDTGFQPPLTELERLEHLCVKDLGALYDRHINFDHLSWFLEFIKPSMTNGSLASLAITFCPETRFMFDKVLNKKAIHTLSCFSFTEQSTVVSQCGDTFVHWLEGFPYLTTLGVFPQKFEGCWMLLSKVLAKDTRIKTIYTNILTGVWRDWILDRAREKSVKIIEADSIPEPVLQPLESE
ncbi:hypothetical protein J7T55_000929 [Diaporthe amygdali]|uniref:uncharacterized protein n=1 Tax=Phomopsis amygdali TaxID=1214568 RepID=UPI0022FE582F|nr:uncharacterized protein J7T55_000929 [Diaporthe amygdali]KAJ0120076.1 hypothetical protein J7T55_000929 [Diaporthe amygdali]